MKRNTVLLMVITISLIIGSYSCKKEGVYHPKKKISRIYFQNYGEAKELLEKWTWDGNNLSTITAGDNSFSWKFEYEGKRIDRIVSSEGDYFIFSYNKKLLQQIELFSKNGTLVDLYEFDHTKDKVTTVTNTYYGYKSNSRQQSSHYLTMALRCFLPQPIADDLSLKQKRNQLPDRKAAKFTTTYEYVWEKNNIKSLYISYSSGSYEEYSYKYDNFRNPFYYSFLPTDILADWTAATLTNLYTDNLLYSKNNVSSESGFGSGGWSFESKCTLKYENNFPVEIYVETEYSGDNTTYIGTWFYTYQ
jgi:hypothetical protein